MDTVIVPVDFSETSLHAAGYAAKLLTGHYGVHMILYHFYEKGEDGEFLADQLKNLQEELFADNPVKISTLCEEGSDFIAELTKLARHREADLIIMGITGRSSLQQTLIGSNTLKMVEKKVCPVLIIPHNAAYHEIKNVMLASDFKDVFNSTPSVPIKKLLKLFQPNLYIVNVNSEHYIAITESYNAEKVKLNEMFAEFNPEFYFLSLYNVEDAINLFTSDKNINLIINIQKDHSVLHRLYKSSHTKQLAYHSPVPVLAVHE